MFLIFRKRVILQYSKKIYCIANFSRKIQEDTIIKEPNEPNFFAKLLDMPHVKAKNMLEKNPVLLYVDKKDVIKSVETLKSLKYTLNDIKSTPMILYLNYLTIQNRYTVFKECGCEKTSTAILSKFLTVMNRSIESLKINLIMPRELNVQNTLENCFNDIEVKLQKEFNDNIELKIIRYEVLNEYLRRKLDATDADLNKLWKTYVRLKHRNYKSICKMIHILKKDLDFTNERILKNGYVLYGEPDNVERLMKEIKTIANEDFKTILYRRPKIMMTSCDSVLKTIEYVKQYEIPETAIIRCLEILTLGSETVKKRLDDLNGVDEFRVLKSNPRFLRLVHYSNKAIHRLDYLNQLKVRCVSLDILSSGSEKFEKFTREGTDRHKGRDIIVYLTSVLHKSNSEIRRMISRHPNWCHVPIVSIKECYEFLTSKLFSSNDIYANIYLLLYPISRISEKLNQLEGEQIYGDLKLNTSYAHLTNSQILNLCLYLIELEFHFTGDGIWTEQNTQQVENFSAILPDFFESFSKTYRYGGKPSKQKLIESGSGI